MGATEIFFISFRYTPMEYLALLYQLRHSIGYNLRLYIRVYAVLQIQVDMVGLQSAQGAIDSFPNAIGS